MTVPTDKKGTAMTVPVRAPKKLIEVALPLDDINAACAREKSIRHGHPSALHLWWARRPLAAARAVLFAQLVNDPGYERSMSGGGQRGLKADQATKERERLFGIIRRLVQWENVNNEQVLAEARAEISKSWRETCELNKHHPEADLLFTPNVLPAFHDPFAGGGALPLEAQRLGLDSYASDLNPVAVLINKAMIEIPPKFAGLAPINPDSRKNTDLFKREWTGIEGLIEDVRYYGKWMLSEARKQIGHLYPTVKVTAEMANEDRTDLKPIIGKELKVIAWIWARTVKSPNPAFSDIEVPLVSTYILCNKAGKNVHIEPVVDNSQYRFVVRVGQRPASNSVMNGTKTARGNFFCLMSGTPIESEYIRTQAKAGRLGTRLLAVVADSSKGRIYLSPDEATEALSRQANPDWQPDVEFFQKALGFRVGNYGMSTWNELFTSRQLVALSTFSKLTGLARELAKRDAQTAGMSEGQSLHDGGTDAAAYADALSIYLAFVISKLSDLNNSLTAWKPDAQCPVHLFSRHAIPMVWDFAEANPLGESSGSWLSMMTNLERGLASFVHSFAAHGHASQADARRQSLSKSKIISTDPPYYDNVPYADLSDFFYVWLRHSLTSVLPDLFATVAVPKLEELVATPNRHGGKEQAERFFLDGMTDAMQRIAQQSHPGYPISIYYAFKQTETSGTATTSTGWETFISAIIRAGLVISGTWPMRTELSNRMRGMASNALASSIIIICRKRDTNAPTISRRDFIRELKEALPEALKDMTYGTEHSPVAAVDLSQALIGPGMSVFSKYQAVLEADGSHMTVKTALQLINRHLAGDDTDFDPPTRFCLAWFESHDWDDASFGEADTLARAKGTSVDTVASTGAAHAKKGIVHLLKHTAYPSDWTPPTEGKPAVWEALHHLIRAQRTIGIGAAGRLLAYFPTLGEPIRQLAYRLYTLCERNNDAEEARAYNELITSWPSIVEAAQKEGPVFEQGTFL